MGNFNRGDNRGGDFSRGGGRGGFNRGGRGGFNRGGGSGFDRGNRGDRPLFDATCSNCGKDCQVPFRPTNGKPVYCSDCFEKMGNGGRDSSRRPDERSRGSSQAGPDLGAINAKLDKILSILEPKVTKEEVKVEPVKKTEEPKVKNDKKAEATEKLADKVDLTEIKEKVKKVSSKKKK